MKTWQNYLATSPAWVLAVVASLTVSAQAQHFGYSGEVGPEDWCGLSPDYVACCGGVEQSPLNIVTDAAELERNLPKLKFHFPGETSLSVVNNGHTVQANVPAAATIEIGGLTYNLLQFHFHTPSEHTVNGQHAPIEMHLVHKTADGTHTAVVGVFIVPGKENKELEKIWSGLPTEEGEETEVAKFNLQQLLPAERHKSYRYLGSLTTPPCTEGVLWNLLANSITMSNEQISKFQAVFSGEEFPQGNARPTQPSNGRVVLTNDKN